MGSSGGGGGPPIVQVKVAQTSFRFRFHTIFPIVFPIHPRRVEELVSSDSKFLSERRAPVFSGTSNQQSSLCFTSCETLSTPFYSLNHSGREKATLQIKPESTLEGNATE